MSITYSTDYVDFPYYLYDFYDYEGSRHHTGEQDIEDEIDLASVFEQEIANALKEKRKLVMTDMFGYVIFHADKGAILFPKPRHLKGESGKWINHDGDLEIR